MWLLPWAGMRLARWEGGGQSCSPRGVRPHFRFCMTSPPRTQSEQTLWPTPPLPLSLSPRAPHARVGVVIALSQPTGEGPGPFLDTPCPSPLCTPSCTLPTSQKRPRAPPLLPPPASPRFWAQAIPPGAWRCGRRQREARVPVPGSTLCVRMGRRMDGVTKMCDASTGQVWARSGTSPSSRLDRGPPTGAQCPGRVHRAGRVLVPRCLGGALQLRDEGQAPCVFLSCQVRAGSVGWHSPGAGTPSRPVGGSPVEAQRWGLPGEAGMGTQAP